LKEGVIVFEFARWNGLQALALGFADQGLLSAAAYTNRDYVGDAVRFDDDVPLPARDLLFDPQTSGGLLICCPTSRASELLGWAREELSTPCGVVGRVDAGTASVDFGLGARLSMTPWGPFIEACANTAGSLSAVGGARYQVAPSLWLEGSAGVATFDRTASPVLRVELAHTLASTATIVRQ